MSSDYVEYPFHFSLNERHTAYEIKKTKDDTVIASVQLHDYADYLTSLLNLAHGLGKQANKLASM